MIPRIWSATARRRAPNRDEALIRWSNLVITKWLDPFTPSHSMPDPTKGKLGGPLLFVGGLLVLANVFCFVPVITSLKNPHVEILDQSEPGNAELRIHGTRGWIQFLEIESLGEVWRLEFCGQKFPLTLLYPEIPKTAKQLVPKDGAKPAALVSGSLIKITIGVQFDTMFSANMGYWHFQMIYDDGFRLAH